MGLYEDRVARALDAQERARVLTLDAARVTRLARVLRDARSGGRLLYVQGESVAKRTQRS